MASIFGHAVSIIGIKKLFPDKTIGKKVLLLGIVSSILPDIDVIGESFGITAFDNYGYLAHRGLTHSIMFGLFWAIVLLKIFHDRKEKLVILKGIFYFICTISHGVLDAMTTGGDGITFFLPFSFDRVFFPYRFIEVSPIGISAFFSTWGFEVLISEFKYIGVPSLLLYIIGFLFNKYFYE